MTSVDTNILVRLLTEDDAKQFQKASALFETKQIFIKKSKGISHCSVDLPQTSV